MCACEKARELMDLYAVYIVPLRILYMLYIDFIKKIIVINKIIIFCYFVKPKLSTKKKINKIEIEGPLGGSLTA